MSKKCVAFSKSKLGLEKPDNRKAFYAGWEAAMREALAKQQDKPEECADGCPENTVCDYCQRAEPVKQEPVIWHSVLDFVDVRRDPPEQGEEANWLPLYAAPVDAKAIRAEAFKEAAKVVAAVWGYVKAEPVQEPVKQEPVGVVESSEEWGVAGVLIEGLPIGTKLYAAPVDAKAIRAEALEEAEEIAKTIGGKFADDFLAAIRSLK